VLLIAPIAEAATVTLTWDPNPEPDIASYLLSYGTASGQYTTTIDVGNVTSFVFTLPDPTKTYYLAVQAINTTEMVSSYSNEVSTGPPANPLTVTTLVANQPSPQTLGATITFTATATGGTPPYQFKWWISDGVTSTIGRDWAPSNAFAWTPTAANANYTVTVWARNASSTADTFDNPAARLSMSFAINAPSSSDGTPFGGTAAAVPGTIEAERFNDGGANTAYRDTTAGNSGSVFRTTDVDLEPSSDVGGGYDVGWVDAGEWLNYTVNVATTGTYTLDVRVASIGAGGTFHVEVNHADRTGPMVVPNTGGWQAWTTMTVNGIQLAAGTQVVRLVIDSRGPAGVVANINWLRLTLPSSSGDGTPFGGTAAAVPGTIEAERFNDGGAEVAYHDLTTGNSGTVFRATDVDLETSSDTGGGYDVGWVDAGEWLNYTVNVTTSATYTLGVRVASIGAGGTFHVEVDHVDRTGAMAVPNTGGWQNWTTLTVNGISLTAGNHVVRLSIDSRGPANVVANFNWLRFTTAAGDGTAFGGTPPNVPGTIEAERFNDGGAEVAYHDTTTGNSGNVFRATDVDLEPSSDTGGGYDIGWVDAGEWLNYSVNVTAAGTYALDVRVASVGAGGTFHVEVDHVDRTGPMVVPNTGGWQTWTTLTANGVSLPAGTHVLRLVIDKTGAANVVANFNWLRIR